MRNSGKDVSERIRNAYKRIYIEVKRSMTQTIQRSKRRTDEDFGRRLNEE